MKKLSVFLSSAMTGELDQERAVLRSLFSKTKLDNFYDLYAIENHSSPNNITDSYVYEVKESQIYIVLFDKILREAVVEEFNTAERNGVKIFCYIKNGNDKHKELNQFIRERAFNYHCGSFFSSDDLIQKIESDLIDDLLKTYKKRLNQGFGERPYFGTHVSSGPRSEYRYHDLDIIINTNNQEDIKKLEIDQLMDLAITFSEEYANYRIAILLLEIVLFRDPDNWMAYNNRGILLNDIGYEKAAEFNYHKTVELNTNCDSAYYNLGKIYYNQGKFEKSIEHFKRAIELVPNKINAINSIAASYLKLGDKRNALNYSLQAIDLNPDDRLVRFNYISALSLNGRKKEAFKELEEFEFDEKTKLELETSIYYQNGKFQNALDIITKIEKKGFLDLTLSLIKFYCLVEVKKIKESKEWAKELSTKFPLSAEDYNNIGHTLCNNAFSVELAIIFFRKSIDANPHIPNSWNNLQAILGENERLDEALSVCKEALELHPFDPKSIRNQLIIYTKLNKPEQYTRFLISRNLSFLGISNPDKIVDDIIKSLEANSQFRHEYFSSLMNFIFTYLK